MSDNVRDELAELAANSYHAIGKGWIGSDPLLVDPFDRIVAAVLARLAERGMVVLGPDGEPLDVRPLLSLTVDAQGNPVDLLVAKPGDVTQVYEDVEGLTEFGWVAHLDYFDDRDEPVKVRRIRLRVLEREDMVLGAAAAEVEP